MNRKVVFSEENLEHDIKADSDTESIEEQRQFNKFKFLDLVDGEDVGTSINSNTNTDDDDDDGDDGGEAGNAKPPKQTNHNEKTNTGNKLTTSKKKPRRRGKRGSGKGSRKSSEYGELDENIDNLTKAIVTADSDSKDEQISKKYKLLKVDARNLIPEAELKRIFGRTVVKDERARPKIHPGSNLQRSKFVSSNYFETKPSHPSAGPKMEPDDTINNVIDLNSSAVKTSRGGSINTIFTDPDKPVYFKFVHDRVYQDVQRLFLDAVNRGHSDFIVQNLSVFPTHAESLVQLSHMVRVSEDYKTASEFIERSLVVFERGFHPKFNIGTATCRLSYKRPENRTFFITIFKHINCCQRRGLRQTPFEYSKLLLSLEPENDPLMAVELLVFFAIRCDEYDYIIDLYAAWDKLQKLPSLRFSLALAHFFRSRRSRRSKEENETNLELANELLKEALLLFPNFIIPLLDACSGEPDAALRKCSYFDYSACSNKYKFVPETVDALINLYVRRSYSVWKQKEVLSWLERNVAEMVADFSSGFLTDQNKHIQHWSQFPKITPKNLLRHIVLCDLDLTVPNSASSATYIDIDPFPPSDSIITYDATSRGNQLSSPTQAGGGNSESSSFEGISGLFLRSILPSFSLADTSQATQPSSQPQSTPSPFRSQAPPPGFQPLSTLSPFTTRASQPPNRLANTRLHIETNRAPGGGSVFRVAGPNREFAHHLDQENTEAMMTIIGGLRDLDGIVTMERPGENTENSDNRDQPGAGSQNGPGQDGLRRRQQPR